jgi:predicted amidophosphoribosyltransferase
VVWAAAYEGVARELVASLKFRGRLELARLAGSVVAGAIERAGLGAAGRAVVPVPAAPLRLRRRGFDPGELIGAAVASELGLEVVHCLTRRSTRRQVGRGRRARLADPPRVRPLGEVPAAALVIDDVLTTGATLGACATALRAGGCTDLTAAVFARSLGAGGGEA